METIEDLGIKILDVVIDNFDYFRERPAHLAWVMMNYELIYRVGGGAIQRDEYIAVIRNVGFNVRILGEDKEISERQYGGINLESLKIEAYK